MTQKQKVMLAKWIGYKRNNKLCGKLMKYKVHTITVAGVVKSIQDAHTPDEACKKATGLYGGSSVVTESGEMNSETLITILNLRAAKIK